MTLSRARDPFTGINHWKRKHIPAATQICQHLTAARARARARVKSGTWHESARMTEMIPSERERTRVNKREIMTRPPRPTLARIRLCHVHARFTYTRGSTYGRESPTVRHAGFSGGATEKRERDARRISEEARESHVYGTERERAAERTRGERCSSVDDSSLPWGARAAQPYSVHACVHADARVCGAARAGTGEALSALGMPVSTGWPGNVCHEERADHCGPFIGTRWMMRADCRVSPRRRGFRIVICCERRVYRIFIKVWIISSYSLDNLHVTDEISRMNESNSRNRSATDFTATFSLYMYIPVLFFLFKKSACYTRITIPLNSDNLNIFFRYVQ